MSAVGKGKILLIEDDIGFRSVYTDVITADGYTVVTAEDGEQGLAMIRTEKTGCGLTGPYSAQDPLI